MTQHAKEKLARKNREKDAGRRRLTVEEVEKWMADMRKQEAEINERLETRWSGWCEWYNMYAIPRITAGFFYAALKIAKKMLTKQMLRVFMDELEKEMQRIIDEAGKSQDMSAFDEIAAALEKEGYAVPQWAKKADLEETIDRVEREIRESEVQ